MEAHRRWSRGGGVYGTVCEDPAAYANIGSFARDEEHTGPTRVDDVTERQDRRVELPQLGGGTFVPSTVTSEGSGHVIWPEESALDGRRSKDHPGGHAVRVGWQPDIEAMVRT